MMLIDAVLIMLMTMVSEYPLTISQKARSREKQV